jgi:hypothetical protein
MTAAFQDRIWRPRLGPLLPLARTRVVHCTVDPEVAFQRMVRRGEASAVRAAHADPGPDDAAHYILRRARGWALWKALACLLIGDNGTHGRPGGKATLCRQQAGSRES